MLCLCSIHFFQSSNHHEDKIRSEKNCVIWSQQYFPLWLLSTLNNFNKNLICWSKKPHTQKELTFANLFKASFEKNAWKPVKNAKKTFQKNLEGIKGFDKHRHHLYLFTKAKPHKSSRRRHEFFRSSLIALLESRFQRTRKWLEALKEELLLLLLEHKSPFFAIFRFWSSNFAPYWWEKSDRSVQNARFCSGILSGKQRCKLVSSSCFKHWHDLAQCAVHFCRFLLRIILSPWFDDTFKASLVYGNLVCFELLTIFN